ncbi:MAG: chromate resistance protein [Magnetococcus sp. YQC-9]
MPLSSVPYLALLFSLPARNATERMRAWRALKNMGGAILRDGVYLLPSGSGRELPLIEVALGIQETQGLAEVVGIVTRSEEQNLAFRALFDRQADYQALRDEIARIDPEILDVALLKRAARHVRRRFHEIIAIDFFPGDAQTELQKVVTTLEAQVARRFDSGEPVATLKELPRRDPAEYQERLWVTRANLWVDRLASAWLIRRFIDRKARFHWLRAGEPPPDEGVGFDFDGAPFTHIADRITFETLMAAFALENNPALQALGRMIHALDVGGISPEAAGFEALLKGIRLRCVDDDALLEAVIAVLDDFYRSFSHEKDTSDE